MKILIILGVLLAIYFFFFKKRGVGQRNDKKELNEEIMVECRKCKTFVSSSEAIVGSGSYFCSKECLR